MASVSLFSAAVAANSLNSSNSSSATLNSAGIFSINSNGPSVPTIPSVKPIASTNSGSLSMSITLAEPILFLQGFERAESGARAPAFLRGTLKVHVAKPTKIKAISLWFNGKARTEWPEGIPPAKEEYSEEKDVISHAWPFFSGQFTPDGSYGADIVADSRGRLLAPSSDAFRETSASRSPRSSVSASRRSGSISRSAAIQEIDEMTITSKSKNYRLFPPGDYHYNFELLLDSALPESIECTLGSVRYELEATIERPGAFKSKLVGKKSVLLVRTPAEANLENGEPIVVSRNWEDQLHYDIVIGGKAFPIGTTVPVAFKLTPLAKVRCHRIRILITENTEYFCHNKKVHRIEPVRKYLLYEHGSSNETNLLGDLDDGSETAGPIEFELNAKIPGCEMTNRESLRPDTTYANIKVHHWIKVLLRLSKTDPDDPSKRRHFEVSIDSPFHLLSCRCTMANVSLPAYNIFSAPSSSNGIPACPCVASEGRNSDPDFENTPRPVHLLRRPSLNPPPFDADIPPPPLVTPPPEYDEIIGTGGYFDNHHSSDDEDEDLHNGMSINFSGLSLNPSDRRSEESITWSSGSGQSSSAANLPESPTNPLVEV
ncbi:hypothetical protein V1511DRAFT_457166 [Dipodascopsis uninucleata]